VQDVCIVFPRGCIAQLPHRGLFGLPRRYWAGKLPEPDYMSMSGCLAFPSQCALFALRYVPLKVRGSSELHVRCVPIQLLAWFFMIGSSLSEDLRRASDQEMALERLGENIKFLGLYDFRIAGTGRFAIIIVKQKPRKPCNTRQ